MITLTSLLLVVFLLVFLCYFESPTDHLTRVFYRCFAAVLLLIAATRPVGLDQDSISYAVLYIDPMISASAEAMEPSFRLVVAFLHLFFGDDYRSLLVTYALLSIPLRAYAIGRLSPQVLLAMLLWCSHYFVLQDMTQIRVAVSTAFLLWGLSFLQQGRRWAFAGTFLGAFFFHYSSILMLPLLFFSRKDVGRREFWVLLSVIPLSYGLVLTGFDPIHAVPVPFIQEKMEIYDQLREQGIFGDKLNIFGVTFLLRVMVFYFAIWKYRLLRRHVPALPLLLRVYALALCSFLLFSSFDVYASRISEFYGIVEIIILSAFVYAFRPPIIGRTLVVLYALAILFFDLFNNELLNLTF